MKKKDVLQDATFLKSFTLGEDLTGFFKQIHKRIVEKILEGELDLHLGYDRHNISSVSNARNGYLIKKIKTSFGESDIQVPRDRNATFCLILVPKRGNIPDGLENIILSLYTKKIDKTIIESQLGKVYNFDVSRDVIVKIADRVCSGVMDWYNRPLGSVYITILMDKINYKIFENSNSANKVIYLAVGLKKGGKKEILGMWHNTNESVSFFHEISSDLKARGIKIYR